jgi:CRISPR-associated endoribonuclease Cas6
VRFRVDVAASAPTMAWSDVHGPARGVIYDLLKGQDPELATELHDGGWQGHSLRPLGMSPPLFAGTKNRKGVYTTSEHGSLWFGSPVPKIAGSLLAALAGRAEIRWGHTALTVRGVQLDPAPDHAAGKATFESVSPIIVKHENRYLLPDDAHYTERLTHNLRHKADALGLPSQVEVEVLASGQRRRFDVQKALRIGATARIQITAAPALLDALYDWGLGLNNVQAFGWVR